LNSKQSQQAPLLNDKSYALSIRNFLLILLLASGGLVCCRNVPEERSAPSFQKVDAVTSATRALLHPCQITEIHSYEALHFDPSKVKSGRLSYRLSRAAWVRVQVVLRKDPTLLIRTIIDWTYQEAGKHSLFWDGRDSSGYLVDKRKYPCMIIIEADKEIHRNHDWSRCNLIKIMLKLPRKVHLRKDKTLRIHFTVAPDRSGYIRINGLTARLYFDYEKVLEKVFLPSDKYNYVLYVPFTLETPTEHLITLVVSDGADHSGSASKMLFFLEEP